MGEYDGTLDGLLLIGEEDGFKDGVRLGLLVGVEDGCLVGWGLGC